jgi:hypothetical protein
MKAMLMTRCGCSKIIDIYMKCESRYITVPLNPHFSQIFEDHTFPAAIWESRRFEFQHTHGRGYDEQGILLDNLPTYREV